MAVLRDRTLSLWKQTTVAITDILGRHAAVRYRQNREKESKRAVAKRQGRGKPARIEQRKVRGAE